MDFVYKVENIDVFVDYFSWILVDEVIGLGNVLSGSFIVKEYSGVGRILWVGFVVIFYSFLIRWLFTWKIVKSFFVLVKDRE